LIILNKTSSKQLLFETIKFKEMIVLKFEITFILQDLKASVYFRIKKNVNIKAGLKQSNICPLNFFFEV
jgi:hypothetical protein